MVACESGQSTDESDLSVVPVCLCICVFRMCRDLDWTLSIFFAPSLGVKTLQSRIRGEGKKSLGVRTAFRDGTNRPTTLDYEKSVQFRCDDASEEQDGVPRPDERSHCHENA